MNQWDFFLMIVPFFWPSTFQGDSTWEYIIGSKVLSIAVSICSQEIGGSIGDIYFITSIGRTYIPLIVLAYWVIIYHRSHLSREQIETAIDWILPSSWRSRSNKPDLKELASFTLYWPEAEFEGCTGWMYPPQKLTYPPKLGILKRMFLFPRQDMLVLWRVCLCFSYASKNICVAYHYVCLLKTMVNTSTAPAAIFG